MLFLARKFVAPLFFPLTLSVEFIALGLLLIFMRRQTAGRLLSLLGLAILVVASLRISANAFLMPLESRYPALDIESSRNLPEDLRNVRWVVVLGGGSSSDPRCPVTSRVTPTSLVRLAEGIRLQRIFPGSKLIVSGGSVYDTTTDAYAMERVALALGVNKDDIVAESESKDTDDQARLLAPLVRRDQFILVTSASHMPRAVQLFSKLGMHPVPAPTDFSAKEAIGLRPSSIYPTTEALGKSERAAYEYLGEFWSLIRGKI